MECKGLPADPCSYPDDFPGEEVPTADDFRGHYSTNDLFELVWQGGGVGSTGQPGLSCLRSSPLAAIPPPPPQSQCILLDQPPFEDTMAAWLYPIVTGPDYDGDGLKTTAKEMSEAIGSSGTKVTETKGKLLSTDGMSQTKAISRDMASEHMQPVASRDYHEDTNTRSDNCSDKASGGSSSRKGLPHNSETHNIAEKRRRCKITDRLRTLQQLVPGCDKSNQASTLDQTIQYMKSLQNHVQAMSMRLVTPSSVATAGYPVMHTPAASPAIPTPMPPAATVDPGTMVAAGGHMIPPPRMLPMVPLAALLPYPYHHYSAMMHEAAAAAMAASLYRPPPDVSIDAAGEGHDFLQCSVSMQQRQHKKMKGGNES